MERVFLFRVLFVAFIIILLGMASLYRTYLLQTRKSPEIESMIKRMWERVAPRYAKDGKILARDRRTILATSTKVGRIVIEKDLLADRKEALRSLSSVLLISEQEISERLDKNQQLKSVDLLYDIPVETAEKIDSMNLPGVFVRYYYQRFYPFGDKFAPHIIGYKNERNKTSIGIERMFLKDITGEDGRLSYDSDNRGRIIPATLSSRPPKDGKDIITTLDKDIQLAAEDVAEKLYRQSKAKWVLITVMDAFTGEILASAVDPAFDPNEYAKGPSKGNEANPLTQYIFEPGSILKPIIAAVALDRGWITEEERFFCTPTLKIGKYVIHEAEHDRNPNGFGNISIRNILVHSSNVGMARIGLKIGQDKVLEAIRTMGITDKTGIELPSEAVTDTPKGYQHAKKGFVLPDITVANLAFGQGIAMTPIALLRAYSAIVNGGVLVNPKIVYEEEVSQETRPKRELPLLPGEEIVEAKDVEPEASPGESERRVISRGTSEKMREILEQVVSEGTGKRAKLNGFIVGGKTGTGQVAGGKNYLKGKYTSSFIGFFPKREPRYLILVVAREPKGYYYGGLVCAPAFKELAEKIVIIKRIPPESFE